MSPLLPLFCMLLILLSIPSACMATVFAVGDNAGWDISADLTSWPVGKNFVVGDVLSFQYSSLHSVNEVNEDGFDRCSTTNVMQTGSDGNTSIPLTTPGQKYFICGVVSHCLGGMKLRVSVNGGRRAMAPAGGAPAESPNLRRAPTSPVHYPSENNAGDPSARAASGGFLQSERDSLCVALLCALGTLLWVFVVGF